MSIKANNFFQEQPQHQIKEESKQQLRQNSIVHFETDIPLVVVEIPLKNGKIAKLPIFEFSQPDSLAAQFVKKYQLDEKIKKPIRKMIEQQMSETLTAKQLKNSSDNPSYQSNKLNRSQSTVQVANQSQKYYQQQQQQNQQYSQREYLQNEQLHTNTDSYNQNINDDMKYEQNQNKYNPPVGINANQKEEKQIENSHQQQTQKDKKNKIGLGYNDVQIKNNEQQYQNLKKLKNKDFFTENSETENEQSEFIVNRKPIGKSSKTQNYNDEENKTLQKNRQTQSSALLTKQQHRKEYNNEDQDQLFYQQKVQQPQRQQIQINQYNVPSIVQGQQQYTKSILKQNRSQENILMNNQQNDIQDIRAPHSNTQHSHNQNRNVNENRSQKNNENQIQQQREIKKRDEEQEQRVNIKDKKQQQYDENEDEVEYEELKQNQNRSYSSNESQDSQYRKNHQQVNSQKNNYNDVKQQQKKEDVYQIPKQEIQKSSIQSGQFTFNEEEEEETQDENSNKNDEQINQNSNNHNNIAYVQVQQNRNNLINQQKFIQNNQSQQQNPNRISSSSNASTISQTQKHQGYKVPDIKNQVNQVKTNQYFIQEGLNQKGGDEDDTEVDELNQMYNPKNQKNSKVQIQQNLTPQNIQNFTNKSEQTENNNRQNLDEDIYEDLDVGEHGDFNKIDEASDIKHISTKQQEFKINRAPHGALKQNPGNPNKSQPNQIQIPKQVPPFINKRKEEIINSQNVFNKISIDQNEVSDFTGYVNQNVSHKQIIQKIPTETNNHNQTLSPQGFMSPQNYGLNNIYLSPTNQQQQLNQIKTYQGTHNYMQQPQYSPNNNELKAHQRMNMYNQPQIHQQFDQQQDLYSNNNHFMQQNYNPHTMYSPISQQMQFIQPVVDQNQYEQVYQNQRQQQNFQPSNQNYPMNYNANQFMINNINPTQTLNSSFLTNNLVNTSINSSIINRSLTPRRRIFDENPVKTQNRFQPQQALNQLDYRGYGIQQQYTTPQKSGTNTPLRYRNNEQTMGFAGYPSRSISPNNQYFSRRNDFQPQSNINSQSLQFHPNQFNQRGNQFPQQQSMNAQSMQYNQNQFIQRGFNQNNQQYAQNNNFEINQIQQSPNYNNNYQNQQFSNNGLNNQNQNYYNSIQNPQTYNNNQQTFNSNQNYQQSIQQQTIQQQNTVIQKVEIENNPAERMITTPRNVIDQKQNQNHNKNNIIQTQNKTEVSSTNVDPPERQNALRTITPIQNYERKSPSPTQIISPKNYNFKNMNIPLFEQRKQKFQEEFKQLGLDNNISKTENSHNQSNQFAPTIPSTPQLNSTQQNTNTLLSEPINNIASLLLKPANSDQQFKTVEYTENIENKQNDSYNIIQVENEFQQQHINNNDKRRAVNQNNENNGIMFSLNTQYKDSDMNNIEQLFNLLDVKKLGYISSQSIDYSKLPIHHQLRLELNSLLQNAFLSSKNVDFNLFYNTATQKNPQIIQVINYLQRKINVQNLIIFSGKNNQQSTQPPIRPPSFGFAKDQPIFQ